MLKPDPKPTLGPAAMEANLEYYQAIARKHFEEFTEASNQAGYWQRELEKVNK